MRFNHAKEEKAAEDFTKEIVVTSPVLALSKPNGQYTI